MKISYRSSAVVCLFLFASLAGCAADGAEPPGSEAAPEQKVIRYTSADIAALQPGELLHLDLTRSDVAYMITYTDPAELNRVLADLGDNEYIVGDRVATTAKTDDNLLKQVALSRDMLVNPDDAASTAPSADEKNISNAEPGDVVVSCTCPCSITVTFSNGTSVTVSC